MISDVVRLCGRFCECADRMHCSNVLIYLAGDAIGVRQRCTSFNYVDLTAAYHSDLSAAYLMLSFIKSKRASSESKRVWMRALCVFLYCDLHAIQTLQ